MSIFSIQHLEKYFLENAVYVLWAILLVLVYFSSRGLLFVDNTYSMPKVDIKGHCCKTNIQSNTAFRGFGGPQALFVVEDFMDKIACQLDLDPFEVREKNLYHDNDKTYYRYK